MIVAWAARRDDVRALAALRALTAGAPILTTPWGACAVRGESPAARAESERARNEATAERTFSVERAPSPYVSIGATARGIAIERGGFGGRPAFMRREPSVVLASTDLEWVIAASRALGLRTSLCDEGLAASCLLAAPPSLDARSTIVREIEVIPPATRATIAPDSIDVEALAPPALSTPSRFRVEDAAAELRARLETSVARAMAGDARVGVLTGGGLDSGALLALAHRRATAMAFAIDFASEGDDRPHLAALAATLGVETGRVRPGDVRLPESLTAAGLPLTWPSGAAEASALRAAQAWGAERVLSGAFADAWLDGDPEHAASLLFTRGPYAALRVARAYDGASRRLALRRVLAPWVRRAGIASRLGRALARSTLNRTSSPRIPPWAGPILVDALREGASRDDAADIDGRLDAAFRGALVGRAAELRLQEERLSGVLRVDPFLDAELVTFALALPPSTLLADGVRRGLFREAARGLVPEPLRLRHDKASFAPLHASLFAPPHARTMAALRTPEILAELRIVEPRVFTAHVDRALADRRFAEAEGASLHPVLATEAYARTWYHRAS